MLDSDDDTQKKDTDAVIERKENMRCIVAGIKMRNIMRKVIVNYYVHE